MEKSELKKMREWIIAFRTIRKIEKWIKKETMKEISEYGLEYSTINILSIIGRFQDSGITTTQIAEILGHTKGALTRPINLLILNGIVISSSTQDQRKKILKLTPDGEALAVKVRKIRTLMFQELLVGIKDEELSHIRKIVQKIDANIH